MPVAVAQPDAVTATVEEDGMSLVAAPGDTVDLSEGNKDVTGDSNADDETSGLAGTLTALFAPGADEELEISLSSVTSGLPALLSKGEAVSYAVNPAGDFPRVPTTAGGRGSDRERLRIDLPALDRGTV